MNPLPVVFVVGPTGSGKSKLAIELALRLQHSLTAPFPAEIINVDVMQMYQGLPIATNKATVVEQKGIPHHLLGFLDPLTTRKFTVHDFLALAIPLVDEIKARGAVPIVCGGTNYYIQGLLCETLVTTPEEVPAGEEQTEQGDEEDWLKVLQEVDPIMALRWHPNDIRRIRRSVEVYRTTGKRHSDILAAQGEMAKVRYPHHVMLWVHAEPDVLREKIARRVAEMDKNGIRGEVSAFYATPGACDTSLSTAIGFKEFLPFLANPTTLTTEDDSVWKHCLDILIMKTASYARQQSQWIRNRFATNPAIYLYRLESSRAASDLPGLAEGIVRQESDDPTSHPAARFVRASRFSEQKGSQTSRCLLCDKVLQGGEQLGIHMASKHHKKMVAREKRQRERKQRGVTEKEEEEEEI